MRRSLFCEKFYFLRNFSLSRPSNRHEVQSFAETEGYVMKFDRMRIAGIICTAVTVVLELLPWGAVCVFAGAPGSPEGRVRETYSYFDPLPFGYANLGPLMTAVLSCVLLGLWLVGAVFEARLGYFRFVMAVGLGAVVTSGMPLLMGIEFCSAVGGAIFVLMLCVTVAAWRLSVTIEEFPAGENVAA